MDTKALEVRLRFARTQAEGGNVAVAESTMQQTIQTLAVNDGIPVIERYRIMNLYHEVQLACSTVMRKNYIEAIRFLELQQSV